MRRYHKRKKDSDYGEYMLIEAGIGIVSLVGGWYLREFTLKRNLGLKHTIDAVKNKDMIVYLEEANTIRMHRIIKRFKLLGVTESKQLVIIPDSAMKHCSTLGVRVGFGDQHRNIAVPVDLIHAREMLKNYGFSEDEIAWFFKEIHDKKTGEPLKKLFEDKKKELYQIIGKDTKTKEDIVKKSEVNLYDVYTTLSFAVKDFILSGINQTTIVAEMRNIIAQKELEKLGGTNWIKIAIAVAIVLVVIFMFGGDFIKAIMPAAGGASAPAVLPNPLGGVIGK